MKLLSWYISCPSNFGGYCWGRNKYPPGTPSPTVKGVREQLLRLEELWSSSQPQVWACGRHCSYEVGRGLRQGVGRPEF